MYHHHTNSRDHLLVEMKTGFDHHQQTALQSLYLVPSLLVAKKLEEVSPTVDQLGDLYMADLPFRSSLLSDFQCWYMKWKDQEKEYGLASLPTTLHPRSPQQPDILYEISKSPDFRMDFRISDRFPDFFLIST